MLFLFRALVAWRKFIITAVILSAGAVAGISLLLPSWYSASTSVFPPESNVGVPIYTEMLQNLQMPLLGPMGTGARPETIFIDMLKSRHVGRQLVEEFDLKNVYDVELFEHTLNALGSHTAYTLLENGLLIVSFEDTDPKRAAAIANRYVELLDAFNRELNISSASRTREFIEGQLKDRQVMLAEAEVALQQFQETHQALELEEQLHSTMTIVTDLTAEAIALETEMEILKQYTSPSSDEYVRKKRKYEAILSQLNKLKRNHTGDDQDLLRAYLPTLDELPELALQFLRLKRKVEVESTVYMMLLTEYEKSRIEEARDMPTVQVMDHAEVPNQRSRPRRKMLVVVGGFVGFGWSAFLAVVVAVWREEKEHSRGLFLAVEPIRADWAKFFRRK